MEQLLDLPLEIIGEIAKDPETLVSLAYVAHEHRRYDIYNFLIKKGEKMKDIDIIREYFKYGIIFMNPIDERFAKMTPQKIVRIHFELDQYLEGYKLFKNIKNNRNLDKSLEDYISNTYKKQFLQAYIALERWDHLENVLSNRGYLMSYWEAIKLLSDHEKQLIRAHLSDVRNLLMIFIMDSENTDLDEWTDELILSWLEDSPGTEVPGSSYEENIIFIRGMLYRAHGDPRWETYPQKEFVRRGLARRIRMSELMSRNPTYIQLMKWRGSEEGLKELLMTNMMSRLGVRNVDSLESILDIDYPRLPFNFGFVLARYPSFLDWLIQFYLLRGRTISYVIDGIFSDESNLPLTFDLLDYKDQLGPVYTFLKTVKTLIRPYGGSEYYEERETEMGIEKGTWRNYIQE